ncbi:MBG domain-containing protein [Pedobacter gandavensis]|uniref:MBG domain-containing protein n=1 Tax=Pedobacter gandavensis TaxID=2679963 RepID=UPI00292FC7E4|nr:MBG domain-containing protein [Pedobacter gandavensis]
MKKHLSFKFFLLSIICFCFFSVKTSYAQLGPGDIAIVGVNGDDRPTPISPFNATLAIVALVDIPSGTEIKLTDYGWDGTAFRVNSSDGRLTWTLTQLVPKGTVLSFTFSNIGGPAPTIQPSTYGSVASIGWSNVGIRPINNISGDSWLIYTGTEASPNFIYGFINTNYTNPVLATYDSTTGWTAAGNIPNNQSSILPSQLVGTNAYNSRATYPGGPDLSRHYNSFNQSFVGSKESLLNSIKTPASWVGTNNQPELKNLIPGTAGGAFEGAQPVYTVSEGPTVTSVTSTANGAKKIGDIIPISVTFSEIVNVVTTGGTPQLALGTTPAAVATYSSGSGTNTLVFNYTVGTGQTSPDLDYAATSSLSLQGGTIKNAADQNATLTLPAVASANSLGGSANIVVDGIDPTIMSVTGSPLTGSFRAGQTISIQVNFSENVTVTGTPILNLNVPATASYVSGSGSSSLTFSYQVLAGQNKVDLDYASISALALAGGSIKDAAGNNATITLPALGAANSLSANTNINVDTTIPTVTNVSGTDGSYIIGSVVPISIHFSEAIYVTGSPQLALNTSPAGNAIYASGSGTNTLVFNYTVLSGQSSPLLNYTNSAALTLNGGTLKDPAGNDLDLTLPDPASPNSLGTLSNIVIKGIPPAVQSISRVSAALTNALAVNFTVTFNEPVTGVSLDDFSISTTGVISGPSVVGISGSGTTYTLTTNTGTINGTGTLRLDLKSSGTGIVGASGNAIATGYTSGQSYTVDRIVPTTTSATIASNNSNPLVAKTGDVVTLSLLFSEPINILTVTINGNVANTVNSGLSSTSIYTVSGTDPEGQITFNVGYSDAAGNNGLPVTATTNASKVFVDNIPTIISSVSSSATNGPHGIGTVIPITVNFSKPVIVTGVPQLALNSAANAYASYASGSGTTALTFNYTVASGHTSPGLDYRNTTALTLNGGTINNQSTLATPLDLPAPGTTGSLADGRNIIINGIAPTVLSIVRQTPTGQYTNANSVQYSITFSEPISGLDVLDFQMTTGSAPASSVGLVAGSGSVYTITVGTGLVDGNISINLKSSGTGITNMVGNPILTGFGPSETYIIDKTLPTIFSTTIQSSRPGAPSVAIPGDIITLNFTSSEPISTPTVSISGNAATAQNTTGNNWVATYTMQSANNNGIIPFNIIYSDLVGNAGTPKTTTTNSSFVSYDKTPPTLPSVSITSNSGNPFYAKAGSMVTFIFTASETLSGAPVVTIGGVNGVANPFGALNYFYTYTLPSDIPSGLLSFAINFKDVNGNPGVTVTTVTTGSMITVDNSLPTLSNVNISSNNSNPIWAKSGDQLTLTFTSSEEIRVPTVKFFTNTLGTVTSLGNNNWSATYNLGSSDPEGPIPFNISYVDLTGNDGVPVATTTNSSSVTYDRTAPVSPTSLSVTPGDKQNTMLWTLNADYAKYELIGGTTGFLNNQVLTTVLAANASSQMSFTQTGLTNSLTYLYALQVSDAAGNSSRSLISTGMPAVGQTITFDQPIAAEYGSSFTINATSDSGLPVSLSSNNPALATISGNTVTIVGANNLQSVSITASQPGDGNYSAAQPVIRQVQIKPKPVTVTANAQSKSFNDTEPVLTTPSISPALIGTDLSTGQLARETGENAGTYEIQQNTFSLDPYKYAITYLPANFTISPKIVTIIPYPKTKNYNAADPTLAFGIDIPAVTVMGPLTRAAGEDVGIYDYSISSMSIGSNYQLAMNPTPKFSITPLVINVTATAGNKQYGDTEPVLAYTNTPALKSGDSFNGTLTRLPGEAPGTYPVIQGTLALSTNYLLNYNPALVIFTVKKKNISITPTAGQGKVYGQADGIINYVESPALINGDTFSGALGRTAGNAVGVYPIAIGTLTTSNPQNYNLQLAAENYAITQKTIMVTATAVSKAYGDADPVALTYTLSEPLSNGDVPTGALSRIAGTTVGTYPIQIGNLSLGTNYDMTFTPANLTITPKAIAITAVNTSKTYGDPDPGFTYTNSPALIGGDVFTGALGRDAGEDVGSYPLSIGNLAVNSNYALTLNPGTQLSIIKKVINVVADAKSKVYGNNDPVLTYQASTALIGADQFSGALSRLPGEHVGNYEITQAGLALSSNYSLNYTPANLSITAKPIDIQINAKSKVYGAPDPELTFSSTPLLVSGDVFTGAISRAPGESKNNYLISKGSLAASTDYILNFSNANFEISAAPLTITADSKTKFLGTANPVFTGQFNGFVNGEDQSVLSSQPSYTSVATTNSPIGTYPIVASGAVAANYQITHLNGVLTVVPGAPTNVLFAGTTLFENQAAGTLAGTLSSTSDDPNATFTYTLTSGNGDTDNALFRIAGNQLLTTASLDYENKKVYSVKVSSTTQHGFSLDKTFTINLTDVNEIPTLDAIANKTICYTNATQTIALTGISAGPEAGQNTTLTVTGTNAALLQSLTISSGTGDKGTISYRVKNGASGISTITVTVKDNGGTENGGVDTYSRTFVLSVNALPVVSISANIGINNNSNSTNVSKGESVVLTASGGTNYTWALHNSIISGQNSASLTVRPRETTTYTVTVTNANGCSEQKSFTINVMDDLLTIKATNILTPNGDGYNDKWVVDNIDFYPNNNVKIFDKAGRLVYSRTNYDNGWDGTLNGSPLNEGTYYYVIDFGKGRPLTKGFITIVREN